MDISLATMEGVIQRKKVPVLFLKIESELDVSDINAVFMNYSSCEIDCCSCSAPLLRLFNVTKKDAILFDILETMEKSNRISTCIGINLPQNFRAIPAYTYADVKHNLLQFTP